VRRFYCNSRAVHTLQQIRYPLPRTSPCATKWKYSAADGDRDRAKMQPEHTVALPDTDGSVRDQLEGRGHLKAHISGRVPGLKP
jgi:hypothetical protein